MPLFEKMVGIPHHIRGLRKDPKRHAFRIILSIKTVENEDAQGYLGLAVLKHAKQFGLDKNERRAIADMLKDGNIPKKVKNQLEEALVA
ncbi:MAG: hypothetical protein J7K68_03600 [Candidatus Diapherotrites archaeon]|nr:hypothetical protein [Candidatus Diapherotrites archaeon]